MPDPCDHPLSDIAVLKRDVEALMRTVNGCKGQLDDIQAKVIVQDRVINKDLPEITKTVHEIKHQAARWKGGLAVMLGLGGFFVMFLTLYDKLKTFFTG